jgi:DNA-binding GntR family transcriptional regulator
VKEEGVSHVARLEGLAAAEYRPKDPESYEEFLRRNREFHVTLAEISGNARLIRVLSELIDSMQRFFFLGLDLGDFAAEMREEHEELMQHIRGGDEDGAVETTKRQIERSRERILKALFTDRADLPVT